MPFLLKKFLAQIIYPLGICELLLLAGLAIVLFTRRQKLGKGLLGAGVFLLLSMNIRATSHALLVSLEKSYAPLLGTTTDPASAAKVHPSIKWVVVLGGAVTADKRRPPNTQLDPISLTRLLEGIRLYRLFTGSKLLLSGGALHAPIPIAEGMRQTAESLGVKHADIVLEIASPDTEAQAVLTRKIIGDESLVLVTSAIHMRRSMMLFQKQGMRPVAAPADFLTNPRFRGEYPLIFDVLPSASRMEHTHRAAHEYVGIWWSKLRGRI